MERKLNRRGFSLLEVLMALVVLGVGLPAIAMMFTVSIEQDVQASKENRARYLANSLISEISQRRFRESLTQKGNGPDAGETDGWVRTNFDDIDDYSIFTDTWIEVHPPRDEAGNVITGFEEFTQKVTVDNVAAPSMAKRPRSLATVADGSTDFKLVTVTITWDGGRRKVVAQKLFALSLPEDI